MTGYRGNGPNGAPNRVRKLHGSAHVLQLLMQLLRLRPMPLTMCLLPLVKEKKSQCALVLGVQLRRKMPQRR